MCYFRAARYLTSACFQQNKVVYCFNGIDALRDAWPLSGAVLQCLRDATHLAVIQRNYCACKNDLNNLDCVLRTMTICNRGSGSHPHMMVPHQSPQL